MRHADREDPRRRSRHLVLPGLPAVTATLPDGVLIGHWTDPEAWTGCTVCLLPDGSVAACEVRGGAPGTLGTDLLRPESAGPGANAILLTGGSAFGLAAADGVSRWLADRGLGFETPAARVPLVGAAVVYDLGLGDAATRPGAEAGYAACETASPQFEHGSVGAGTGCTVGKLLGPDFWTKGGLGAASSPLSGGGSVAALAVVNAVGDVLAQDGLVLAGIRRGDGFLSSAEALAMGVTIRRPWQEATTLVCVLTDVVLTKTEAWMCARAANAGVARAVSPVWTPFDGDSVFCASTCAVRGDPLAVGLTAADVVAEAIRHAVLAATGAPGCPAASEL
jgi:L-aminopeptidase/D-esterase-like protein